MQLAIWASAFRSLHRSQFVRRLIASIDGPCVSNPWTSGDIRPAESYHGTLDAAVCSQGICMSAVYPTIQRRIVGKLELSNG